MKKRESVFENIEIQTENEVEKGEKVSVCKKDG